MRINNVNLSFDVRRTRFESRNRILLKMCSELISNIPHLPTIAFFRQAKTHQEPFEAREDSFLTGCC